MADQRDPALHEPVGVGWVAVEEVGGSSDHFGRRSGERAPFHIPAPAADRRSYAHRRHRVGDRFGMRDGAGLDDRRDAVPGCFERRERRREPVVVVGVRGVEGHGPLEDRGTGGEPVGDRSAGQAISGEVLMGVDQTGDDPPAPSIEPRRAGVREHEGFLGAHVHDAPAPDGDGGAGEH